VTALLRTRVGIALAVVGAVAIVALGAVSLVVRRGGAGAVGQARRVVLQDSRFVNGPRAGAAFADVSGALLADAQSCSRHHSDRDIRCAARFSAAAYTSVTAFTLLGCTQPGVFQARRGVLAELDGILALDHRHGPTAAFSRAPSVPSVPSC